MFHMVFLTMHQVSSQIAYFWKYPTIIKVSDIFHSDLTAEEPDFFPPINPFNAFPDYIPDVLRIRSQLELYN